MTNKIETQNHTYWYDDSTRIVMDDKFTILSYDAELAKVKVQNLGWYLDMLYESYYDVMNRFNKDCQLDLKENIIWGE